jgi:hypothetical protein
MKHTGLKNYCNDQILQTVTEMRDFKDFLGFVLNWKKKKNLIDCKIDQIYFYFCLKVFIYWKSWYFSIKSFLQKKLWKVCFYLKIKQKKLFLIIGLITDILST